MIEMQHYSVNESLVSILPSVCILPPVCSLQSIIQQQSKFYTAEIKIQLNTLLSNVCLLKCLLKMFWTGLSKLINAKFLLL